MGDDGCDVLVCIPTYNERECIEQVVRRVLAATDGVDVLVIDDSSPDGTGELAETIAASTSRLSVVHRPEKSGLGPAYRAAFAWGLQRGYATFVEMDADLSHEPEMVPELIRVSRRADLVIGSRYVAGGSTRNWPAHRRLLSRGGNRYVQLVTGIPVRDATSGFRAFRREVLEELELDSLHADGYSFQLETALRAWRVGFTIEEVPITFTERRTGKSKISRAIVLEALWRVLLWGLRGPRQASARHPRSVRLGPGG